MPLTETAIKKAKPGDKPIKLSDGRGMYLLVNPVGSKLWRWKYRVLGKEKVLSLGAYPDVSLAQARDGVDKARKTLAAGDDPMAKRKADKLPLAPLQKTLLKLSRESGGQTGSQPAANSTWGKLCAVLRLMSSRTSVSGQCLKFRHRNWLPC